MIISFVPGGPNDIVGRAVARRLEEGLGQTVIVDNRGGANGTLGSASRPKRRPTATPCSSAASARSRSARTFYPKLGYDPLRDFEHVAMIAIVGNLLVVHPSVPARNLKELIALAKASPGKLNYGSVGGTSHLMARDDQHDGGHQDRARAIQRRGAGAGRACISGEVDFFLNAFPGLLPHVKTGKIRAIAVTTDKRSPFVPGVPTMIGVGAARATAPAPGFRSSRPPARRAMSSRSAEPGGRQRAEVARDGRRARQHARRGRSSHASADRRVHAQRGGQSGRKAVKAAGVKPE